jgi:preprotein translocase SecE subunit
MAEKQTGKPKSKRLVRNPETFRERAVKASNNTDKPKRRTRALSGVSKIARPVARPVGQLAKLGPFKLVGKILRFIGKIIIPAYFRNSWKELRQVTWPTKRVSLRLTFAVLIFAIVFGAIIAVVDFGLDKLFKEILLKK